MIQKPKGTYDIYEKNAEKILYLQELIETLMEKYNYKYIQTPIFESGELFHRGVGETTDIVSKETYDFQDRGGRNLTLRPEGTAGVVRSFIENKLYTLPKPYKTWYFGPMFRYERPQAGRNRQFLQFGVEAFGSKDPLMDAEIISIIVNFFALVGLKGIKVKINTLGDRQSRENYRQALLDYFKPYLNELCDDCKNRYEKNPLRILDCKIDADKEIMRKAPKIKDYLNEESKDHYEKVKQYLGSMEIAYIQNDSLVRGLDYYTHTVFEVEADIKNFGAQNVLGGGGRYNNLIENLGGPATASVGFAVGIDRFLLALEAEGINIEEKKQLDIYAFALEQKQTPYVLSLVNTLRLNGFNVDTDFMNRNIKNNFKQADKLNAKFIIIIGEEEIQNELITIKNNITKQEYKIKNDKLIEFLDSQIEEGSHENK